MYKAYIVFSVVLTLLCANAYAESGNNFEVKVLTGSSDKDLRIKSFYPEILPFEPHDTITFVNDDSVAHSIVSGLPEHPDYSGQYFKTGKIIPAKSATIKTTKLTNFAYYYFCELHPWLTGKIVLANAPESQPETDNPIVTDKQSYNIGQDISVSGQVHEDFAKTSYQILVYKNSDNLVDAVQGKFDDAGSYTQTIKTTDFVASPYTLKVVYGLPTQIATTTFKLYTIQEFSIPTWIKNGAKWWSSGQISDTDFIKSIEYLAKEKIITIQKTQFLEDSKTIPAWFKTNAGWWADGLISDLEFAKGLEYLANSGIIQS